MTSRATDLEPDEIRHGPDPELRLWDRVREWTDVFPWIRLGRTMRVAGSPPLLLLVAMALAVWWIGHSSVIRISAAPDSFGDRLGAGPTPAVGWADWIMSTSLFRTSVHGGLWFRLGRFVWAILVWTPVALLLGRQGALLTAGRPLTGMGPGLALALRRTPSAYLAAVVPLACVLTIGIGFLVLGWVGRATGGGWALGPLAVLAAVLAVPCGLLAFGSLFAVPLSWAAVANEAAADPLDSLSRGYEYVFRRPLSLLWCGVLSAGLMAIAGAIAWGVARSGLAVATLIFGLAGAPASLGPRVGQILWYLPLVVVVTMAWALGGGIYLLLRWKAGGQEVEDLWQPAIGPSPSLPQFPMTTKDPDG